ncbi:MAG TPA: substrate-binding domain-containing protein [Candidatus Binatia bacterium]
MLLRRAQEALAIIEGTKDEIDEIQGLRKEKLNVGGSGLAASFLPAAIQTFKRAHPEIEVTLTIDRSRNLENGLLEGDLDIGVLSHVHSPLLAHTLYGEDDLIVIASPNHPLTKKHSVPLELLAREPSVMFERGGLMYDMIQRRFAESRISFNPTLEVKTRSIARDAIKSAVSNGIGIGFIAKRHVEADIKAGRLKRLKVPEFNLKRQMYVVTHKKRNSGTPVKEFKDFLLQYKNEG